MSDRDTNVLYGKHIALVSTVPYFMVSQLSAHIRYLLSLGMQVTLITSPGEELKQLQAVDDLTVITMNIPRKLEPWRDLNALFKLFLIFRKSSFDILHSTTPKAGLLCALAARMAKVPVRLHTFTGQIWTTRSGFTKSMLQFMDKIIVRLNTHCYTDSYSQLKLLVETGIATDNCISSYGSGSLAGVDLERFSPNRFSEYERTKLRNIIGLTEGAIVFTFVGRITRDKGVYELLSAFESIYAKYPKAELLMLGPVDDESGATFLDTIEAEKNIHRLGYVSQPEEYLAISDVLCLPSYREGFGTVVIEAAAMGVPAIGTNISGLVDAIADGETGLLVPPRDIKSLAQAMETLVCDPGLLQQMKKAAKERCARELDKLVGSAEYSSEKISRELGFSPKYHLRDSLLEIVRHLGLKKS
jgi:glycosyltransferase involved in cell wall biosynthesis